MLLLALFGYALHSLHAGTSQIFYKRFCRMDNLNCVELFDSLIPFSVLSQPHSQFKDKCILPLVEWVKI